MVWYSCCTGLDTTIPEAPVLIHYCFGIILTLTDNMVSEEYYSPQGTKYQRVTDSKSDKELIKTFNCDSSEAEDEGFEPLWYYVKPAPDCTPPDPDPMCGADADVPYQMLMDVNSLDKNAMEVFIPWEQRPVKVTIDLAGPDVGTTASEHSYEAVNETQHWYWTENGFEQEKFVTLEYSGIEDGLTYSDNGGSAGSVECCGDTTIYVRAGSSPAAAKRSAEAECTGGCPDHDAGKLTETFSGTWQKVCHRSAGDGKVHKETIYNIFLPGKTVNMTSRDWEIVTIQGKCSEIEYCQALWESIGIVVIDGVSYMRWDLTCDGPRSYVEAGIRYI